MRYGSHPTQNVPQNTNHHLHLDNNSPCNLYRFVNIDWPIGHHDKLAIVQGQQANVSVITLRNGKELPQKQEMPKIAKGKVARLVIDNLDTVRNPTRVIALPFPSRVAQARKFEIDDELLQTFSKVEINIPLLDTIRQIPKYAKFFKELCINKRKKLKGGVEVGKNILTLIKSKQVSGIVINVIPSLVYKSLRLGALGPIAIQILEHCRSAWHCRRHASARRWPWKARLHCQFKIQECKSSHLDSMTYTCIVELDS
ncbi:hypothetical protein CR513_00280, partial [Mucuna pruriens]